jgi:hypothetical protein
MTNRRRECLPHHDGGGQVNRTASRRADPLRDVGPVRNAASVGLGVQPIVSV